jgi:hypothetical protein
MPQLSFLISPSDYISVVPTTEAQGVNPLLQGPAVHALARKRGLVTIAPPAQPSTGPRGGLFS